MNLMTTWTSRAGESRLDFYSKDRPDEQIELVAKLFQKNVQGEFNDSNVSIGEENITIETKNIHDLMRGIPQETFHVSQLNSRQKTAVMQSLENRNITIERRLPNAGFLTIHALP